jgi:hypothetical protein
MIPPLESCSQKDVQYHRPRPLAFYFSSFSPRGPRGQGILIKDARGLEDGRKNNLLRNRCGHFWERRFRAYLVEDDLYALAALRYMDRNPVRAGIVEDPGTYAWSSCASYALFDIQPQCSYNQTAIKEFIFRIRRRRKNFASV